MLSTTTPQDPPPSDPQGNVTSITSKLEDDVDSLETSHTVTEAIQRTANLLRLKLRLARSPDDILYYYSNGAYRRATDAWVRDEVYKLLAGGSRKFISVRFWKEVEDALHFDQPYLWETPPVGKMSFLNGVLDLNTGKLTPHSNSNWLSSIQIPAKYNPDAKCPKWDLRLSQWFPPDAQQLALEAIAACLTSDLFVQQAIWLVAEGGNGKSTCLTAIQQFLGEQNCQELDFETLSHNIFSTSDLFGKLLMYDYDTKVHKIKDFATWKKIVSHDKLRTEAKFKDSKPLQPFCKVLMAGNRTPEVVEVTEAIFRRLIFVPFIGIKGLDLDEQQQQDIFQELATPEERSGLLNKLIPSWLKLRKTGKFDNPASSQAEMHHFRKGVDPIYRFWATSITITRNPQDFITHKDLEERYNDFASVMELECKSRKQLTEWVRNKYHREVKDYRHQDAETGANCPRGFRFIRFKTEEVEEED